MRRLSYYSAVAGFLLVLIAPLQAQTIKVGSKNFTEQYILSEMYAAALEKAGFTVERKINLGGTLIAHQALIKGEIDLYPEYTGTALIAVLKGEVSSDADKVYNQVKEYYEKNFNATWLKPAGINDGYAMIVRKDIAEKYNVKTLSDLEKVAGNLVLGAGPEFGSRKDGIPGLKSVYGIEFKEFKQFAKLGLRYDALAQNQIDVANGFATDWQIAQQKLATLDDDKNLFPPYFVAPVVRQEALAANPKLAGVLNSVSALLDNDQMRALISKVEQDRQESKDVAREFLKAKGLL